MLKGLLTASLIGSCIFVIFALLKPLTKRRFSCTWHYYAYLIPIFFLCGGIFLLSPLFKVITNQFGIVPITMQTEAVARPIVSSPPPLMRVPVLERSGVDISLIIMLLTVVWGLVAVAVVATQVFRFMWFRHDILASAREVSSEIKGVRTLICDRINTPILIGIFHPTVIFPDIELTADERNMILTHELTHNKRGDLIVKLIVMLVNAAHWFNPLAYLLTAEVNRYCEASCDECVVKALNVEQRKQYGGAILSVVQYGNGSPFYTGLSMSKDRLKGRLKNIMQFEKSKKTVIIVSLIVACALIATGSVIAFSMGIGQDKDKIDDDFAATTASNPNDDVDDATASDVDNGEVSSDNGEVSSDNATSSDAGEGDLIAIEGQIGAGDGGEAGVEPKDGSDSALDLSSNPKSESSGYAPINDGSDEQFEPMLSPLADGVSYRLSAPFGERELESGFKVTHLGADLAAEHGSEIVAVADGTVVTSGWGGVNGQQVVIDHGNDMVTEYYHCSKLLLKEGDTVKAGDKIALVGMTGNSSGNHLHFAVKQDGEFVDPATFVEL